MLTFSSPGFNIVKYVLFLLQIVVFLIICHFFCVQIIIPHLDCNWYDWFSVNKSAPIWLSHLCLQYFHHLTWSKAVGCTLLKTAACNSSRFSGRRKESYHPFLLIPTEIHFPHHPSKGKIIHPDAPSCSKHQSLGVEYSRGCTVQTDLSMGSFMPSST